MNTRTINRWIVTALVFSFLSLLSLPGCSTESPTEIIPSIPSVPENSENHGTVDTYVPEKQYVELSVEYTVNQAGKAEVTGFSGNGNRATINSNYENCPVVKISDAAFSDCATLESVIFWADIEEIGTAAFQNCTSLEEISIPNATTYIGAHAFEGCTDLKQLVFWGHPDIGEYAFAGCISLESFSIPHGVNLVGAHAFDGCISLTSVTVWDKNTSFGRNAFANCPNLSQKPVEDESEEDIPPTDGETSSESEGDPSGTGEEDVGKFTMPNSSSDYIGPDWDVETLTAHFRDLGFTNFETVPCAPDDDDFRNTIFIVNIEEPGLFKAQEDWEAGDQFDPDSTIWIYYNEAPMLTIENCPDLEAVLTNSMSTTYKLFCEEYHDRYVQFDAYVIENLVYNTGLSSPDHIITVAGGYTEDGPIGMPIRIGTMTSHANIHYGVKVGDRVLVAGRINQFQADYFKCIYVETLELIKQ